MTVGPYRARLDAVPIGGSGAFSIDIAQIGGALGDLAGWTAAAKAVVLSTGAAVDLDASIAGSRVTVAWTQAMSAQFSGPMLLQCTITDGTELKAAISSPFDTFLLH